MIRQVLAPGLAGPAFKSGSSCGCDSVFTLGVYHMGLTAVGLRLFKSDVTLGRLLIGAVAGRIAVEFLRDYIREESRDRPENA